MLVSWETRPCEPVAPEVRVAPDPPSHMSKKNDPSPEMPAASAPPTPPAPRIEVRNWTYSGVGRQLVKVPITVGTLFMLLSPFAGEQGGQVLVTAFAVLLVSVTLGAFFQMVDQQRPHGPR